MRPTTVAMVLAALMCVAATARPPIGRCSGYPQAGLALTVPQTFGDWIAVNEAEAVIDPAPTSPVLSRYDVLTRTYVHRDGKRIMLFIAHDHDPCGPELDVAYRPEISYPAQGSKIEALEDGTLPTSFGDINVRRLTTSKDSRQEPVTYWLKVGDNVVGNDFDRRMVQLRLRLTLEGSDGLLFRVSSIDPDAAHAFKVQQQFVADMMAAVELPMRRSLSGF